MSLTLEITRGDGLVVGPPITCSYFSSTAVFTQRGRVEIDKSEQGLKLVTISLPGYRPWVRPGKLVRLVDGSDVYVGKVKSIQFSHGINNDGKPFASCSKELRIKQVA